MKEWEDLAASGKMKRRRDAARELLASSVGRLDEVSDKWRERGVVCGGRKWPPDLSRPTAVFLRDGDDRGWMARWANRSVRLVELPF